MVIIAGGVRDEPDTDDVEAMHLVDHRDEERAVRRSKGREAVMERKLRAPLVVGLQREMRAV